MLGHIAIAAMGGCFSQDPAAGAAEATYFPAESVVVKGNIKYGYQFDRAGGTTDFINGFTNTRFWTKQKIINTPVINSLAFLVIGTSARTSGDRTMCAIVVGGSPVGVHLFTGTQNSRVDAEVNPTKVWCFSKEKGTDESFATSGELVGSIITTRQEGSLSREKFQFLSGLSDKNAITEFWGDLVQNDDYDVHFHRLPMLCAESKNIALYDTDAKRLVEY